MENSDSPINPVSVNHEYNGLTKREFAAIAVLQGMKSNPNISNNSPEFLAQLAVETADALMREFEKTA